MKPISVDLSQDIDVLEIHLFSDEHIGDKHSDIERLKKRIEVVKNTPNAYCILNGDILDTATRSSIGDVETREFNIMEQIQTGIDFFEPIKDKILCITQGNHENRVYNKEGVDISRLLSMQLGIADRYSPDSAVLFIRFGCESHHHNRKMCYTMYVNHGSGGGRKEGAKAIRLADMASIIDVDVYCHSHTHLPMLMKQGFFRIDRQNSTYNNVTKLFVNTAANLDYGGYGASKELKPNAKDTPTIYLDGHHKNATAKL